LGSGVLVCVLAAGTGRAAAVEVVERIIAKVNGEIITSSELARTRRLIEAELTRQGLSGEALERELKQRENDLLRDRIDNILLVQKAKEMDVNVESDVTKQMAEIQRRAKIGDQEKFQDFIREQTGLSYEDFRQ
jgi:parvulin-like peptidyl-prolyl isomerase